MERVATLPAVTADGVAAKLRTFTYEIDGCKYEGVFPQFIQTALEGAERASLTAAARKAHAPRSVSMKHREMVHA